MKPDAEPKRSSAANKAWAYAVVAIGVAAIAYVGLTFGVAREDSQSFQLQRLQSIAKSVSWVAAQELLREDDEAEGLAERFVVEASKVEGVEQILMLKGTKFLVHTEPERSGARLDRDSLEDKALYDRFQGLKATVRKNVDERERRPELTQNAYAEIEFEEAEGGAIDVYAPVIVEEDFEALVRVRAQPVEHEGAFNTLLLLIALLGTVGVVAFTRFTDGNVLRFGGTVLVLAVGVGMMLSLTPWRTELRQSLAEQRGHTLIQLVDGGLVDATAPDDEGTLIPWLNAGPFRAATDGLTYVGEAAGEAPSAAVLVESDGTRIVYGQEWIDTRARDDFAGFLLWGSGFSILAGLIYLLGVTGQLNRAGGSLVENRTAYFYLSPAMLGMAILVFIPVVYGIVLGFQSRNYNVFEFVGLANYLEILSDFSVSETRNFYFKLAVTALWTFTNVFLHVTIGLFLALLLNDPMLKARGIYRVLLVVPWAVPNYITALIWKGLYHKQFGAVNAFLEVFGMEPRSWFQDFWSAFFTNLSTNTWLGFPFMMVVSLGALQSIPSDLYEAARVDGASRWQRFRNITLPLLMPALVPAVIVGTVWTFNMFNIIYLVSGGEPNGATDILITDAFRWAFERDRYGYAAAYSTMIFLILLAFTLVTNRFTGATKGAFE